MSQAELELDRRTAEMRQLVDLRLAELVPGDDIPPEALHGAMRHSLLAPAKRVRPVVTLTATRAFGGPVEAALDPACAIEMVHTASLIIDDFPFMDDARVRRGRSACHHEFGLDIATLASVALLNQAYAVLAEAPGLDPALRVDLMRMMSAMIGDDGIVAGQVRDLHYSEQRRVDVNELERMAREKTGALFVASAEAGARIAGVSGDDLETVRDFAWNLGLCFQVLDDLVDRHGCEVSHGKDLGKDRHKVTFESVLGPEKARERAEHFASEAVRALESLGAATAPLIELVDLLLDTARTRAARQ